MQVDVAAPTWPVPTNPGNGKGSRSSAGKVVGALFGVGVGVAIGVAAYKYGAVEKISSLVGSGNIGSFGMRSSFQPISQPGSWDSTSNSFSQPFATTTEMKPAVMGAASL
jgi:hypothetical protein